MASNFAGFVPPSSSINDPVLRDAYVHHARLPSLQDARLAGPDANCWTTQLDDVIISALMSKEKSGMLYPSSFQPQQDSSPTIKAYRGGASFGDCFDVPGSNALEVTVSHVQVPCQSYLMQQQQGPALIQPAPEQQVHHHQLFLHASAAGTHVLLPGVTSGLSIVPYPSLQMMPAVASTKPLMQLPIAAAAAMDDALVGANGVLFRPHPDLPATLEPVIHTEASQQAAHAAAQQVPLCVTASLYVRNLPATADKLFLYEKFSPFGAILSVNLLKDEHGNSKGVGFVNFAIPECAEEAISKLHNCKVGDKMLHVSMQNQQKRFKLHQGRPAFAPHLSMQQHFAYPHGMLAASAYHNDGRMVMV